jgi:hypothetical protein
MSQLFRSRMNHIDAIDRLKFRRFEGLNGGMVMDCWKIRYPLGLVSVVTQ